MRPDLSLLSLVLSLVCAWLCAAGGIAAAGEVRKCGGREGHSYVSGDCPPGTREVWSRRIEPEPVVATGGPNPPRPTPEPAQRRPPRAGAARRAAPARKETACEAAKRRRDEIRDRDWYTITYERLSALDARVARACR